MATKSGYLLGKPVWTFLFGSCPGKRRNALSRCLVWPTPCGSVGAGAGFDVYPLTGRTERPSIEKIGGHVELASTDHHNLIFNVAGDDIVRHGVLADFQRNPHFLAGSEQETHLYRWKPQGSAQWAMSVDLNACIGCNACVVACQAENNVPVVGKQQVIHEREMHWLRIDRYYEGTPDAPENYFQPMLCMQCEQAPCEVVCPVGATVHDSEGLNVMVYNRCVGTRYCSNNCPYKVRRFNYFAFAHDEQCPPVARNPNVTVRGRGVMEKCTFCLQRIAEARIAADRDNRPVGEVKTACQAACPTQAFTFGNMSDPDSAIAKHKQSPVGLPGTARPEYASAGDLRGTHPQPEPGDQGRRRMTDIAAPLSLDPASPSGGSRPPHANDPVVLPGATNEKMTDQICAIALRQHAFRWWLIAMIPLSLLMAALFVAILWLFYAGIRVWGVDWPVVWGFALINYVWWIAIASGGTFISALFFL